MTWLQLREPFLTEPSPRPCLVVRQGKGDLELLFLLPSPPHSAAANPTQGSRHASKVTSLPTDLHIQVPVWEIYTGLSLVILFTTRQILPPVLILICRALVSQV